MNAIEVERLSKKYRIAAAKEQQYRTVRDSVAKLFSPRLWKTAVPQEVWALNEVSFAVREGESLGIIGRNGAGKSTLLKIVSRITEPTSGVARIRGRVASLLEVGTGFHPELTGRENVFLNGAILGMSRAEIRRGFDEIVAFAEVDRFIDTPVKRFSSGMYVRLAFAVAAQLDAEILLVDEVLAVGDAVFQKKCLGRLDQVAKAGRTVFFVSHQLNQIRRLCDRCLWLDDGRALLDGSAADVVARYELSAMRDSQNPTEQGNRLGKRTRFVEWRLQSECARDDHTLDGFGPVCVEFTLEVDRPIRMGHHGVSLRDNESRLIWAMAVSDLSLDPGAHRLRFSLPSLPLKPGYYTWNVSLYSDGSMIDLWDALPGLHVSTPPVGHPSDQWQGVLNLPSTFSAEPIRQAVLGS